MIDLEKIQDTRQKVLVNKENYLHQISACEGALQILDELEKTLTPVNTE